MSKWMGYTLQNSMSSYSVVLDWLHDYLLCWMMFILSLVGGCMAYLTITRWNEKMMSELPLIEFLWTVLPGLLLTCLGTPSLETLYQMEGVSNPSLSIKVTGNQWYWSYDYSDFSSVEFDSYLKPIMDLVSGEVRLLEVDNSLVLPNLIMIRIITSSSDVLHSWTIPSMGIKVDSNPGRMNLAFLSTPVIGFFFGQCSEICGANHSFMPIKLESTVFTSFSSWIKSFLQY